MSLTARTFQRRNSGSSWHMQREVMSCWKAWGLVVEIGGVGREGRLLELVGSGLKHAVPRGAERAGTGGAGKRLSLVQPS